MSMNKWVKEKYYQFAHFRDITLHPLAVIITRLGISASLVSYSGIILMLGFVALVGYDMKKAFILMLAAGGMDFIDGVVARYQHQASDRGKFIDMVADNVIFSLFVVGVFLAELAPAIWALTLIYLMVLSKLFRSIYNAFDSQSDWFFRSVAGFLPNFVCGICYLVFTIRVFSNHNLFIPGFLGSSIILFGDALFHYLKIVRSQKTP